jgi:hypothetical protein
MRDAFTVIKAAAELEGFDISQIGQHEPGEVRAARSWWSGNTWLYPGEIVVVISPIIESERNPNDNA